MEDITVLGLVKATPTRYAKVSTFNNCIATINRLDTLLDSTLASLVNKHNFYCNTTTTFNKRLLTFKNTTMYNDFALTASGTNNVIKYNTATSLWVNRNRQSSSAYATWPANPQPSGVINLNNGVEISLWGNSFSAPPTFNTQLTSFYAYNNTNDTFTYNGTLGVKIAITLYANMNFGSLPAGGYFIFRIRDVANNTILVETRVYNIGGSSDLNRSTKIHTVCDATTVYSATVQYIGDPLSRDASNSTQGRGSIISFQEL
jgi:hypothetical protein